MQKLYFFCICIFISINTDAQITTGRVRWKSASNIYYTYTGELKDGKPHGRGFAISEDKGDIWIQVFGEFKDGMIDGSTVIRHSTGKIIVAKWKQNKPEGTGVIITPDENIEYGNFLNGIMEGRVINIHWNNKIVISNNKNGKGNGRAIVIAPDGNTITDRIYINDTANGPGYQYEVKNKQLFEGIWEKGDWVKATTGNFPSFMRNSRLSGAVKSDHIYISSDFVRQGNMDQFHDTCFLYDTKNNNRWFGYWERGQFRSGVRLTGDSVRTIGQFDEKGFNLGFGVEYKKERYLYIGNYKEGKLDGNGIMIDIDDSTIYDGYLSANNYSGRATRLLKNKEIKIGNFEKGRLVGEGKTIFPDGRSVSGMYEDGKLSLTSIKEVVKPDGKKIDIHPKDINTAINFLLKEWENNFMNINSGEESETETGYYSWYDFPQGFSIIKPDRTGIDGKPHNEFSSDMGEHGDYYLLKNIYNRLCKEISGCTITSLAKGKSFKLIPKINKLPEDGQFERIASFFTIPAYPGKKSDPQIRVMMENKGDAYRLTVDIISKWK
ncbi:MAG: hypothetical protein HZB42_01940 [Sphingobacteriales bacterium]|nr:hypothetical protein [Sphingobacteriales bacterium]